MALGHLGPPWCPLVLFGFVWCCLVLGGHELTGSPHRQPHPLPTPCPLLATPCAPVITAGTRTPQAPWYDWVHPVSNGHPWPPLDMQTPLGTPAGQPRAPMGGADACRSERKPLRFSGQKLVDQGQPPLTFVEERSAVVATLVSPGVPGTGVSRVLQRWMGVNGCWLFGCWRAGRQAWTW